MRIGKIDWLLPYTLPNIKDFVCLRTYTVLSEHRSGCWHMRSVYGVFESFVKRLEWIPVNNSVYICENVRDVIYKVPIYI
jgi:hypothetical protein